MKELAIILENIDRKLRLKGLSDNAASEAAGKPDVIRNIRRKLKGEIKGRDIKVSTLEAIAKALGTTAEDLRTPSPQINIQNVTGLRDTLRAKIEWLDKERDQALRELEAIEYAELQANQPRKRSSRR